MLCTWTTFLLGSLILISLSLVRGQRNDIFCYQAAKQTDCAKTGDTNKKLCFTSYVSCRRFTCIPHSMWRYNPQKKSCVSTNDRGIVVKGTLFETVTACKVAYARKANMEVREQKCSNNPNDVCQRKNRRPVDDPHFTYDPKTRKCVMSYRRGRRIPYRTYELCRKNTGPRFCVVESESSVECALYQNDANKLKLCFGYQDDCKSYVENKYRVWFYSPIRNSCMKTQSQWKKSRNVYYLSKKECEKSLSERRRVKSCHKIQSGTCQRVPDEKPCNLLEYSFNNHQDCMECLSNYDNHNVAFMTHKGSVCEKSDLNHRFLYLHCSMTQCLYRQNQSNTMVSVKEFGPYYMKLKCKPLDEDEHPGPMYMFKSEEECLKKYNEDKELQERSVGYRYRLGDCRPTMDLKSPGFFKTKEGCRSGSNDDKKQYVVDTMSFCTRQESWVRERSRRAWFRTLEECKEYLEYKAKTKKTFMERSYGGPTFLTHPLDFAYRGAINTAERFLPNDFSFSKLFG